MDRRNLGNSLDSQGKMEEAVREFRAVFKMLERVLGPNDAKTKLVIGNLASSLNQLKKYDEALELVRRLADQNDAKFQFILGSYYFEGQGVTKDEAEAVKWFRKAADQGLADAQYELAICYAQGSGTGPDPIEAYKWVSLAAAQGKAEAKSSQETLEDNLTSEQLAEGRKRAAGVNAKTAK
jgi:TPR repeat protein